MTTYAIISHNFPANNIQSTWSLQFKFILTQHHPAETLFPLSPSLFIDAATQTINKGIPQEQTWKTYINLSAKRDFFMQTVMYKYTAIETVQKKEQSTERVPITLCTRQTCWFSLPDNQKFVAAAIVATHVKKSAMEM